MEEKENEILEKGEATEDTLAPEIEETDIPDETNKIDEENIVEHIDSNEAQYSFKWNYSDQFEHDKKSVNKKQQTKRAPLIYGIIMLAVFVLAFAILLAALSLDNFGQKTVDGEELSVAQIVEKGMPSSVSVLAVKGETYFSSGSGFVVNDYGYIVTNYHVVENTTKILIADCNGNHYSADIINYNEDLDLALLYSENAAIAAATLADSSKLKLGETVVAIGSPTGSGVTLSVSNGIVSGVNRQTSSPVGMIQTNAPLNPGNSGGPLFDSHGNVVGIVTSKLSYTNNSEGEKVPLEGIAYAIPINSAKSYIESWISSDLQKPMLGISAVPVEEGNVYFYDGNESVIYLYKEIDGVKCKINAAGTAMPLSESDIENEANIIIDAKVTGIYVVKVTKGLGAYGKLQKGDIVVSLGGEKIENVTDAREVFNKLNAGDTVSVGFYRNGKSTKSDMTLKTKGDMLAADKNS